MTPEDALKDFPEHVRHYFSRLFDDKKAHVSSEHVQEWLDDTSKPFKEHLIDHVNYWLQKQ